MHLEPRLKATYLVIVHLAHVAMFLTKMVTVSASAQHLRLLQTDVGCKTFAYVYWLTRGLSICTTGLRTMVLAVIISPSSSLWTQIKSQVQKNILPIFILLWLLSSIVNINLLFNTVASLNVTSCECRFSDDFCSIKPVSSILGLFLFLIALHDVRSLGIMGRSSGYLESLEMRATQTVLFLVSCFVALYCTDFIPSLFLDSSLRNNITLLNANMSLVSGYATVSFFLLLSSSSKLARFWEDI
ncbi:vomeronasal type-1 receptor 90-like [Tachyglossus aculeatus]|uniref:vomeronasal type-1 receptor 90-like n=1 Tax=Tachyglossus aculeatus TaxID=9261 RepID=UPI0018F3D5D8|nr:vomeronasal type-1 receptor 90-like [Tachyglossus aculeatus]